MYFDGIEFHCTVIPLYFFDQRIFRATLFITFPDRYNLYACSDISTSTGALPEPEIQGLGNWLFIRDQEHITCHVLCHWSENVSFVWELDRGFDQKQYLPGYMKYVFQHRNNTATFVWALNFTLRYDHIGYKLRCVVYVDNEINRYYKAEDERNLSHGKLVLN